VCVYVLNQDQLIIYSCINVGNDSVARYGLLSLRIVFIISRDLPQFHLSPVADIRRTYDIQENYTRMSMNCEEKY